MLAGVAFNNTFGLWGGRGNREEIDSLWNFSGLSALKYPAAENLSHVASSLVFASMPLSISLLTSLDVSLSTTASALLCIASSMADDSADCGLNLGGNTETSCLCAICGIGGSDISCFGIFGDEESDGWIAQSAAASAEGLDSTC